jgi:hypothetical protein
MKNRDSSILYLVLGIYALLINWHYNHNFLYLLLTWIFWPIYLIYELLHGGLAGGAWKDIPLSYFK